MGVTYENIAQVNKDLSTVDIKGKDYVVVPQRVKAFRMLYPEGFILTDILSHENGVIVMQAKVGYYDGNGEPKVLGTGLAFEKADSSYINKTSYIENCETSAIGRALGFLGLGIDAAICSAEELINAVSNQSKPAPQNPVQSANVRPQNAAQQASVAKADKIPAPQAQAAKQAANEPKPEDGETPGAFIKRRLAEIKPYMMDGFNFVNARASLIAGGVVEDVPSAVITMDQAKNLMDAIEKNFRKEEKAG